LLPLWKSGFLEDDHQTWSALRTASPETRTLLDLIREYGDVDFNDLRGYPANWRTETELNETRVRMATAALLYFDGDAAALVRWVGGPHVAAHQPTETALQYLQGKISPATLAHLSGLFRSGIAAVCNAASSEANFQAFLRYGNHVTVDEAPTKTYQGLVKRKGTALCSIHGLSLLS
jgi:hypothetical protein